MEDNNNNNNNNNNDVFQFILNSPDKLNALIQANRLLHIDDDVSSSFSSTSSSASALTQHSQKQNTLVFVYSVPKVGSTSIVSSLRIFGQNKLNVVHVHDETMLQTLSRHAQTGGHNVTINEIILFNKYLGKRVYVINIYRSPIERKMSAFFEKIGSYHFNCSDEVVNSFDIKRIITRFNNLFPFLSSDGDHFMHKYGLPQPLPAFDSVTKRHVLTTHHGVHYLTLRLKDSAHWGHILSRVFQFDIRVVPDYETSKKSIKDVYARFKRHYRIPSNLLASLSSDVCLQYYYSEAERSEYMAGWGLKQDDTPWAAYTEVEHALYQRITLENSHLEVIQSDHYLDEGCSCKACSLKRADTARKLLAMPSITTTAAASINVPRITHTNAKHEFLLFQKRRALRLMKRNSHSVTASAMAKVRPIVAKQQPHDMSSIVAHTHR